MKHLGPLGWIILALGVLMMCFGAYALWEYRPKPRSEYDPVALIQIGLTLVVGFYLTQYLAQRVGERKAEKDILITNTRDVIATAREALDAFHAQCDAPGAQDLFFSTTRKVKDLGVRLDGLSDLLDECAVLKKDSHVDELRAARHRFRKAVGEASPTPEGRAAAARAHQELSIGLSHLIVTINRLPS